MRAFLEGLLYAVLLVALSIALLLVAGCSTGVRMTDEEMRQAMKKGPLLVPSTQAPFTRGGVVLSTSLKGPCAPTGFPQSLLGHGLSTQSGHLWLHFSMKPGALQAISKGM